MIIKEDVYIYGKHPVIEALEAHSKKKLILDIFVVKGKENDPSLVSATQKNGLSCKVVTEEEMNKKVGKGVVHQGVCARITTSSLYVDLEDFLSTHEKENSCLVLLDELEDPHNVGAIIRSAVAFSASGVLIPVHGQAPVNGTVIKASTGTIFSIPLIQIGNINTTLRLLQERGYWVYALTGKGDTSLDTVSFDTKTVIVIGSEGKGVREKTEELSDFKLSIPISDMCESLNASNAVAVTLYEWAKQNKK